MSTDSTPLDQLQPPPTAVTEQAYSSHAGGGSVGPVIAVLAVITIVGVIAGMIGRLCTSGRIFGHGDYDFERWAQSKCSSCIDGQMDPPPTRAAAIPVAVPPPSAAAVEGHQEIKEEQRQEEEAEQSQPKNPHESSSQT